MSHSETIESTERAADWRIWRNWVTESAGDLFISHAAFEWFVRQHRDELVASRQYIPRKGRGGALVGPEIDRVILGILRRQVDC